MVEYKDEIKLSNIHVQLIKVIIFVIMVGLNKNNMNTVLGTNCLKS